MFVRCLVGGIFHHYYIRYFDYLVMKFKKWYYSPRGNPFYYYFFRQHIHWLIIDNTSFLSIREKPQVLSSLVKPLPTIQHLSHWGRLKLQEKLLRLLRIQPTRSSWIRMIFCWTFRRWSWRVQRNRHKLIGCGTFVLFWFTHIVQLWEFLIFNNWAVHKSEDPCLWSEMDGLGQPSVMFPKNC